jgi:MFS transporter, NNP family, nitrate/nitrite transporter
MTADLASVDNGQRHGAALSQVALPVILLTLLFFLNFSIRQLAGPSLPAIETELGLRHTQSGIFILLMGTGFCLSQVGAAFLAARWGYRRCILVSLWATAAMAACISTTGAIWALYLLFLGLGMAGGLYIPSGIALITVLVKPGDWGKAMGIHELAPNLALICVPFLATAAVAFGSWRWSYLFAALVLALLGLVYLKFGVDSDQRPSPPSIRLIREVIAQPAFWQLCVLVSMAVGVETGIYAMTPLFLVTERGFTLGDANQLLGMSRIPGIILVLLSGWLTDRLSPRATVTIALGITGIAVIGLGAGPTWILIPSIFIQAAASASMFPPILSMASGISSRENRALTISLSIAVAPVIGSGLLPAAIAAAGDLLSFGAGLTATGFLVLAGIGLARRRKENAQP